MTAWGFDNDGHSNENVKLTLNVQLRSFNVVGINFTKLVVMFVAVMVVAVII